MSGPPQIACVLLVEDNVAYARLTELTLDEDLGGSVSVTHVRSLAAALAVLADAAGRAPHVVVADLGLPDAQGTEVVERLRAAGAPPIVVLSGLDTPGLHASLQAAGAIGYVLKGHEHQALAAAVSAAIAAGR